LNRKVLLAQNPVDSLSPDTDDDDIADQTKEDHGLNRIISNTGVDSDNNGIDDISEVNKRNDHEIIRSLIVVDINL
jgi:hypothetical protein